MRILFVCSFSSPSRPSLSFCWQLLKILIALFFFLFSFFFFFSLAGNFATDVDADAVTAVVELSSLCWLPCAFCSLLRFAVVVVVVVHHQMTS